MVDNIEIIIKQGAISIFEIFVYPKNNICYINNKNYVIKKEAINQLLGILSGWKYEYGISNVVDAEEFIVKVSSDSQVTSYHGKGIYPNNYDVFRSILGGIINE